MARRRVVVLLATACSAGLLVTSVLGCCTPFTEMVLARRFDAEAWQAGSVRERGRMALDLERSRRLLGRTRAEVVSLLGQPEGNHPTEMRYMVDLGYRFGFESWLYSVTVQFGDDGRVKHAFVHD